jgi:hypothetical protein
MFQSTFNHAKLNLKHCTTKLLKTFFLYTHFHGNKCVGMNEREAVHKLNYSLKSRGLVGKRYVNKLISYNFTGDNFVSL